MLGKALAILSKGEGVTMPMTVVDAGKALPSGPSGADGVRLVAYVG
jgi:hypothetical protein